MFCNFSICQKLKNTIGVFATLLAFTFIPITNCGAATISANGGSANYSYVWVKGSTVSSTSRLEKGNHFVTITDMNNCELVCSILVYEVLD